MILGIGCDIVKINRIALLIERYGDHFKKKVFTSNEIASAIHYQKHEEAPYYAKRFAAKEAFAKAIGTGIGILRFTDIEISNNELGAPLIYCHKIKGLKVHISLSDEIEFALAYVVIEKI